MSDTLASIFSAIGSAGALLGGATPVVLGGMTLSGLEVPERMPSGGQQQLAVHKMPGGRRVVDAMGPDDRAIEWSGYFEGPQAASRARQMDAMRIAAAPVTLSWAEETRRVVISSFECDYGSRGMLIPYKVSLVVLSPAAGAGKPSLLGGIVKDLADGIGLGPLAADAQKALAAAQSALPAVATLTKGSAAFDLISRAVSGAQGVVSAGQAAAEGNLRGVVAGVAGAAGGGGLAASAQLSAATQVAGTLAGYAAAKGFIGRAAASLSSASP